MKELYKDCQQDYEKNLELYLETEDKKYYDEIFFDFKTYCFNKIRKMRSFLPVDVIDDWALTVTLNAMASIKRKGELSKENWPVNMGAYLAMFCLEINNIKKYSPESIEIPTDFMEAKSEIIDGENLMEIEGLKTLDEETARWVVQEAIKMTVFNDGFSMTDVDRAMKLAIKYNGKIARFSKKNEQIVSSLEKNIKSILSGNVKKESE